MRKSGYSHHDVATEGTATYRLQNPGANVCLASVAAVSGDKDNRLLRVNRVDFAMSAIGPLTLQQQTCCLAIDLLVPSVIQVPKLKLPIMRYELSDFERSVIKPMLPNKPRGIPRVDDRRVPNGIFWILRSGAPWRDLAEICGPHTTCYNRFVRWRRAGVWDQIIKALAAAHDAAVQMIDTSVVRVHQHGACIAGSREQNMGRSRGGLTGNVHAVVDANGL